MVSLYYDVIVCDVTVAGTRTTTLTASATSSSHSAAWRPRRGRRNTTRYLCVRSLCLKAASAGTHNVVSIVPRSLFSTNCLYREHAKDLALTLTFRGMVVFWYFAVVVVVVVSLGVKSRSHWSKVSHVTFDNKQPTGSDAQRPTGFLQCFDTVG